MAFIDRRRFVELHATALAGAALSPAMAAACTAGTGGGGEGAANHLPAPGFYRFALGDAHVTVLSDGSFHLPSRSFASDADDQTREAFFRARMVPLDRVAVQTSPVVVDLGGRRVLVDSGTAPGAPRAPNAGRLGAALVAAGIPPESVDVVVLTHGHPDHVGGLLHPGTGAPSFPGAEVVLSDAELELRSGREASPSPDWGLPAGTTGVLRALDGRLRPIRAGDEVVSGLRSVASPGHTLGHMSLTLEAGGRELLLTGDAFGDVNVAFEHPDWHASFDGQPETAAATRKALLDRAATDEMLILGYHFPFPGLGYALRVGSSYRWHPAGWTVLP